VWSFLSTNNFDVKQSLVQWSQLATTKNRVSISSYPCYLSTSLVSKLSLKVSEKKRLDVGDEQTHEENTGSWKALTALDATGAVLLRAGK